MAIDFSQLEDRGLVKSISIAHHPFLKDLLWEKNLILHFLKLQHFVDGENEIGLNEWNMKDEISMRAFRYNKT
jgi:hypothetical protein